MSILLAEDSIIINEINYNSADSLFPKDWVELYNVTTEPINIGNWIFKDDNDEHEFIIPVDQILLPYGYIVICDSLTAFNESIEAAQFDGDALSMCGLINSNVGPSPSASNGQGELSS